MCLRDSVKLGWRVLRRDHKDRGGQETGNLRKQFENSENFSFIFEIRKQQETRNCNFERNFFWQNSLNFWFLSSMSARSRRALANLEERIQKLINTVFFWPVEVGKILMHFLNVNMNKLDLIRFLFLSKKKFFCQFSRFAVVV